jgi:hypothetical protein
VPKIDHSKFPNPLPKELWKPFFAMGMRDGNMKDDVVGAASRSNLIADALNPTQEDVYLAKSLAMAMGSPKPGFPPLIGGNMKAVVSHDGYILDGHHRWAATLWNNPLANIKGIQVAIDIVDLVPILRAAGDAFGNERRSKPKDDMKISDATIEDVLKAVKHGKGMQSDPKYKWNQDWCMQWLVDLGKGNIHNGEHLLAHRLANIKKHETPKLNLARKDMPVIDADKLKNGRGQEETVSRYLRKGMIDIRKPYAS